MTEMEIALQEGLPLLGLHPDEQAQQTMCRFGEAVIRQNAVMNLTAITEPSQVAKLHLLDSLSLLTAEDPAGKTLIDIGCGAGFPGVPVKIACPSVQLTLLDSLGKRMKWLEGTLRELQIDARCVTARAEEAVASCRETYDLATSRAVARLNILLELTAPYVKPGGKVLAMKGAAADEELKEARKAIKLLGLELEKIVPFSLPGEAHQILVFRKVAHTPAAYPRRFAKIKQSPLL